ncbi:spore coat protein GerQ [Paenibacillus turpanensis]|uniref:spore coat protein GerQ n=1 Tax=Paenibacillus turpanensis TaxID=2689078 RepID=UPI001FB844AB|nr:spore coat protein GerQ [Paenibacillus turpanensis]
MNHQYPNMKNPTVGALGANAYPYGAPMAPGVSPAAAMMNYPGIPGPAAFPSGGPIPAPGTLTAPAAALPPMSPVSPGVEVPGLLPTEQSYIENILRLNLGKIATIYMTFENNKEWNAKVFKGRLEAAGRDHIIISDPQTGMRYLLLMVNLDYVTFDEELQYTYPYAAQTAGR